MTNSFNLQKPFSYIINYTIISDFLVKLLAGNFQTYFDR